MLFRVQKLYQKLTGFVVLKLEARLCGEVRKPAAVRGGEPRGPGLDDKIVISLRVRIAKVHELQFCP